MADLSTLVDADDPIVGDLLVATLELVAEAGGWVNPHARLLACDGQLGIECDDDTGPLMRIPREVMVRVDQVTWVDDPERLTIDELPNDIGDLELPMLYTQLALHNQCSKLPWLTRTHPALADDLPEPLIEAVRNIIPSFRERPMTPIDVLFANRCFRIDLGDGAGPQRLLIPVVDLLNHHRTGATADWDGHAFEVSISRPFGSAECALDYGLERDAMELAVVYGFVDESADVAHSAPVSVDVPGIGVVQVLGTGRSGSGTLPPIQAFEQDGGVIVSHLTFRAGDPHAVVSEVVAATGWDVERAHAVIDILSRANRDLLKPVIDDGDRASDSAAAQLITAAARHHEGILATAFPEASRP